MATRPSRAAGVGKWLLYSVVLRTDITFFVGFSYPGDLRPQVRIIPHTRQTAKVLIMIGFGPFGVVCLLL